MKRTKLILALVGLVSLSVGAWWLQNRNAAPRVSVAAVPALGARSANDGPVAVEVVRAVSRDLADDTGAVGSLRSRQSVVVRPEVSGRVVQLGFQDGQLIRRGQLLVQLDDALQQAQLRQAEAQFEIARSTLQRNRELVAQNFVTQSVVDQAQANLDVAEAQVALARAQLAKLRIVAPFNGQAGIRAVDVGDYLKDGADIVALQDTSSLYVDFSLPERFVGQLQPRQKVAVTVDASPGRIHQAVVLALEPQITADGRAIAVRASLSNAEAALRPGMFARVRVVLAERAGAVLVPEQALVSEAGRELLVKVVDGPRGPTSQRVEVRTGLRRDGEVEILSGLQAGEWLVTAGQLRLLGADDQPLRVIEKGLSATGELDAAASGDTGPNSAAPRPVR